MERNKEYFMRKIQEGGYKVDQIFDIKDIEEVMALIVYDHDRAGCSLSEKNDYGTLREVLKSFIPANEARRESEGMVITTATQSIVAIDPTLVNTLSSPNQVAFSANVNNKFLTAENIGSKIPGVVAEEICNMYAKQREKEGRPLPESEKFNRKEWDESGVGSAFALLGSLMLKHALQD